MSKLVLIDGNAIIHRAYHAMPALTANDGSPINAVYGFISMLLRIIQDLKPTHIAVAWDTPKPTFRHAEYTNYQAHRPRMESDLSSQFSVARDVLKAMNIPQFSLEGFEADDVIGTISKQCMGECEVVIVTGDRDILQLVSDKDKIRVFMPTKGISQGKVYHDNDVIERMGVKPSQIIDFKALVGDPSDNYPGVTGIGPKTAIDLIEKFETLENIYDNLWQIPEKTASKLASGAEPAGISQKLATIVRDVPITFHLKDSADWDIKSRKVLDLFKKIGFRTLTERVVKLAI